MLGLYLGNSGAPSLELVAQNGIDNIYSFKEPLSHTQSCQFSFSGINSQLERYIALEFEKHSVDSLDKLPKNVINNLAKAVQDVTISHVITQLDKAMEVAEIIFGINKLALVGGVACNQALIAKLTDHITTRNSYQYRKQLTNKFINRQLKVIRKFRNKHTPKDILPNLSTNDLINKLWNGDILSHFPYNSKDKPNVIHVFDNEKWNKILNTFLNSIDSIQVQKIVNGLIHLHDTSLYNVIDLAKISSSSILNTIIDKPEQYNNKQWKLFVSSKKRCRDNAPMIGWSVLEKLKNNLKIYSIKDVDGIMKNKNDVYDKWDLSRRRNLDILSDLCKLDAVKLLYNYNG